MIISKICQKDPFDIIVNDTKINPCHVVFMSCSHSYSYRVHGHVVFTFSHVRWTLWLWCVHIAQLMTHPSGSTLLFTLQSCYKPLGVMQRVAKSLKVYFSIHDILQNFPTSYLLNIGLGVPPEWWRSNRNLSFSHLILNLSSNRSFILTAVHSSHKHLQETIISNESFFDILFNCTN